MFIFVHHPARETLRDFNERLREFCSENAVIEIEAASFGPNLVIQGQLADDVDAQEVPTFTAAVRPIDPTATNLEELLDTVLEQEMAKHRPEDENGEPNLPIKFIFCQGEKRSWAVLLCINGTAEDSDDQGGGDDPGEGEPTPPPTTPASAGFQG